MELLLWALTIVPLPWLADALFRFLWAARSKRAETQVTPQVGKPIKRVLVLIPSRREGSKLVPTLQSLVSTKGEVEVHVVVILDGADAEAEQAAQRLGAQVLLKKTPGPTKGAVLRFAARALREDLRAFDAVMILDVGSTIHEDFFNGLAWPPGVSALQARLQGLGCGPGEAASLSERLAQDVWDQGKQLTGWSVRLRGTGTLFQPAVFLRIVESLKTQIEDTEASLLLQAEGGRAALVPSAVVVDLKPGTLAEARTQRARWLRGQLELLVHQPRAFLKLAKRHPLAALGWAVALVSRPLSLTVPARILLGISLALLAWSHKHTAFALWGLVVATSALGEVGWLVLRYPKALGSALQLAWSWVGALWLLPRAGKRWLSGRGRGQ